MKKVKNSNTATKTNKKSGKSLQSKKEITTPCQSFSCKSFFLYIFLSLIALILIFFLFVYISTVNLLILSLGGVSFILIVVFMLYQKQPIKESINLEIWITRTIALLTVWLLFMGFVASYDGYLVSQQTFKQDAERDRAKLSIEITPSMIPWGNDYNKNIDYQVEDSLWNHTSFEFPVFVRISNWGSVNTEIFSINRSINCLNNCNENCSKNWGFLNIHENDKSTLIRPGETYSYNETLSLLFDEIIRDSLPCDLRFEIRGPNFDTISQSIFLQKKNQG